MLAMHGFQLLAFNLHVTAVEAGKIAEEVCWNVGRGSMSKAGPHNFGAKSVLRQRSKARLPPCSMLQQQYVQKYVSQHFSKGGGHRSARGKIRKLMGT